MTNTNKSEITIELLERKKLKLAETIMEQVKKNSNSKDISNIEVFILVKSLKILVEITF